MEIFIYEQTSVPSLGCFPAPPPPPPLLLLCYRLTYVSRGRGMRNVNVFISVCGVRRGGGGAKVETEVGVQVEAGAGSELNAPFYASSLPLAPPAPAPLPPSLCQHLLAMMMTALLIMIKLEWGACVCREGAWPELKQFA